MADNDVLGDAYKLAEKLFRVMADNGTGVNVGLLAVANLTAQILMNLADSDKEAALTAFDGVFAPNVERMIEVMNVNSITEIHPRS